MTDREDLFQILITTTMGESILVETLRSAAYFVTRSTSGFTPQHHVTRAFIKEAGYCYYFIQGTGLDMLIERYHLDYDPEEIRNQFNYLVKGT